MRFLCACNFLCSNKIGKLSKNAWNIAKLPESRSTQERIISKRKNIISHCKLPLIDWGLFLNESELFYSCSPWPLNRYFSSKKDASFRKVEVWISNNWAFFQNPQLHILNELIAEGISINLRKDAKYAGFEVRWKRFQLRNILQNISQHLHIIIAHLFPQKDCESNL